MLQRRLEPGIDHALGEEMFALALLQRVGPERRGGGIGKEAARVREFGVTRFQFRHGLAHAFGIFRRRSRCGLGSASKAV